MGSGKSSVGSALASLLSREFIDLDNLIVRAEGKTITEIFRYYGEEYFRLLERQFLASLPPRADSVVALGGGTFCREENRRLIRERGISVWLDCPLELLLMRIPRDGSRPLFRGREQAEALYNARIPHYRMADLRVDAGGLSIEQVAQKIIELLQR